MLPSVAMVRKDQKARQTRRPTRRSTSRPRISEEANTTTGHTAPRTKQHSNVCCTGCTGSYPTAATTNAELNLRPDMKREDPQRIGLLLPTLSLSLSLSLSVSLLVNMFPKVQTASIP